MGTIFKSRMSSVLTLLRTHTFAISAVSLVDRLNLTRTAQMVFLGSEAIVLVGKIENPINPKLN